MWAGRHIISCLILNNLLSDSVYGYSCRIQCKHEGLWLSAWLSVRPHSGKPFCRVVEFLGSAHMTDICEPDCTAEHTYHFVRAGCMTDRKLSKLDLKVDLHLRLRAAGLNSFGNLPEIELQVRPALFVPQRC